MSTRKKVAGIDKFSSLPSDVIRKIAMDYSLNDIHNLCLTSQKFNAAICDSEAFWQQKVNKDYPKHRRKDEGETWKQLYEGFVPTNFSQVYLTHDNSRLNGGGRPFLVDVNDARGRVRVFKRDNLAENREFIAESDYIRVRDARPNNKIKPDGELYTIPVVQFNNVVWIFPGEDPLLTPDQQKIYIGNSILLDLGNNVYAFIGAKVFTFTSYAEIIEYVSIAGNSDLTYPYAIDVDGNIYLLIENIVLKSGPNLKREIELTKSAISRQIWVQVVDGDPYGYYYTVRRTGKNQPIYILKDVNIIE